MSRKKVEVNCTPGLGRAHQGLVVLSRTEYEVVPNRTTENRVRVRPRTESRTGRKKFHRYDLPARKFLEVYTAYMVCTRYDLRDTT